MTATPRLLKELRIHKQTQRILSRQKEAGPGQLTELEMADVYDRVLCKLRRKRRESEAFDVCVFLVRRLGVLLIRVHERTSTNCEAEWRRADNLRHWVGNYTQASPDDHVLDDVVGFNRGG